MSSCSNPKHFSGRVWFRPTKPRTAVILSVEKLMGNDARDSHNQMQTVSVGDHAVLSGLEATNCHTTCVHVFVTAEQSVQHGKKSCWKNEIHVDAHVDIVRMSTRRKPQPYHVGPIFVELELFWIYICRTWAILDLHLSKLTYFGPTFVELNFWTYICRTWPIWDLHLSTLSHFGLTFVELQLVISVRK